MSKVKREDVELLLSTREALYALFHRALGCEPNDALIQVLTAEESRVLLSVVPESEAGCGALKNYLTELDKLAERYAVSPSEALSAMREDWRLLRANRTIATARGRFSLSIRYRCGGRMRAGALARMSVR